MPVVSNSGPILCFARAQRLDLLHRALLQIYIPDAVYEEIVVQGTGKPGSEQVAQADWIHRRSVSQRRFLDELPKRLHLGEQEAIALAKESNLALLIDEKIARQEAARLGIPYFGSLKVLQAAKENRLLSHVKPCVDDMIAAGMHVDDELYGSFLKQVNES